MYVISSITIRTIIAVLNYLMVAFFGYNINKFNEKKYVVRFLRLRIITHIAYCLEDLSMGHILI